MKRAMSAEGREPLLFTPGPLTTSRNVKQAMLVDFGSRDKFMIDATAGIREGLLKAAYTSKDAGHECVIVQGAGTMGIEAMLGSAIPRDGGKVLILINGAYGHRQVKMCKCLGIPHSCLEWDDSLPISIEDVLKALREDSTFTHVSLVHHETSAGVINPLEKLTKAVKAEFPRIGVLVDSMSGFGAYELRMDWGIEVAVSSANKCIEGVPGFCFAICDTQALRKMEGNARSFSLDLYDQWANLEKTGQFRFTPPTHAMLAFRQALAEWEAEGGVSGRLARYRANFDVIRTGMEEMGFKFYVTGDHRSCLISTFIMPEHPAWNFDEFYRSLSEHGFVIYPGKLAKCNSFRFGTIGRIFPTDCSLLIAAVRSSCARMGVPLPLQ